MNLSTLSPSLIGGPSNKPAQSPTSEDVEKQPTQDPQPTTATSSSQTSNTDGPPPAAAASDSPDSGQQTGNNGASEQAAQPTVRNDLTAPTGADRSVAETVVAVQSQPQDLSVDDEIAKARAAAEAYQAEYARTAMLEAMRAPQSAPVIAQVNVNEAEADVAQNVVEKA